MRNFILVFILFLSIHSLAQNAYIGSELSKEMSKSGSEHKIFRTIIMFENSIDIQALKEEFIYKSIPVSRRPNIIMNRLKAASKKSQYEYIKFLKSSKTKFPSSIVDYQSFWIANMMIVEQNQEIIIKSLNIPGIKFIELENYRLNFVKPVSSRACQKSINSKEPGLAEINAPALWAMGYTGKGRISYSVDTGVWTNHPAIGDRFLGNYLPMSQSWFPVDSDFPVDKPGAHGTHTLGTTLGLDRSLNDTIGVAFNAYWIASDPVATSLDAVNAITAFVGAFQWAFNPDGDTNTTSDIPDVINNSWGYSVPTDTALCTSFVSDMLEAVEAAGIANVFSAGNDGPDTMTISEPHHIVKGLVNTFTVGAVNAHISSYPITDFSSRGPTSCPGSGSLKIKPEVVAPGFNVRSSVENGQYAEYSGTSMAAPHVTGAVLLLKEAFPYMSGEDILLALYYTASDLGQNGEDNTYGNGMIDVLAAFNYLAQNNIPAPSASIGPDLVLKEIILPEKELSCEQIVFPSVVISNEGDIDIQSAQIQYRLNDENIKTHQWTGNLIPGESDTIELPAVTAQNYNDYDLKVIVIADFVTENDIINNNRIKKINIRKNETLPYYSNFNNKKLVKEGWYIVNNDKNIGWDTISCEGPENLGISAFLEFNKYVPKASQIDEIYSPILEFPDTGKITLEFFVAYRHKHILFSDTLRVYASTDCGETFPFLLYKKGGDDLNTNTTTSSDYFIPDNSDQWRKESIDLSFLKNNDVILNFQGENRFGNNLFIDDVAVLYSDSGIVYEDFILNVYPNPVLSIVNIDFNDNTNGDKSIKIIDVNGRIVKNINLGNTKRDNITIDLSKISSGILFLHYSNENSGRYFKIVKI